MLVSFRWVAQWLSLWFCWDADGDAPVETTSSIYDGLVGQILIWQLDKYYPCLGGQMVLLLTVGQILPGPDPLLGKYYRFQILLELGKYFWILLVGQILLNPSIDLVGQKPLNPSSWANGWAADMFCCGSSNDLAGEDHMIIRMSLDDDGFGDSWFTIFNISLFHSATVQHPSVQQHSLKSHDFYHNETPSQQYQQNIC